MRRLSDPAARAGLESRLAALSTGDGGRWGRLSMREVMPHCLDQLRIALGEQAIRGVRGPLRFWPIGWLSIHLMPWPKGRVRGPREAFVTPAGASFDDDRAALLAAIERMVQRLVDPAAGWPLHPTLGRMRGIDWDVLTWRHLDHHLRQFGR